jgi:hypothetical protein
MFESKFLDSPEHMSKAANSYTKRIEKQYEERHWTAASAYACSPHAAPLMHLIPIPYHQA